MGDKMDSLLFDIYSFTENKWARETAKLLCLDICAFDTISSKFNKEDIISAMQHYLINFYMLFNATEETCIAISRDKNQYRIPARYGSLFFKYDIMIPLMDMLEANDYIEIKLGYYDHNKKSGETTRLTLTNKMKNLLQDISLDLKYCRPSLVLKNKNKDIIHYDITAKTKELKKIVVDYNNYTNQHEFLLDGKKQITDLTRIFNNSSWSQGGRFYGKIQNKLRLDRPSITIDNQSTVEIDFSGIHPNMLYHLENKQLEGKAYDLGIQTPRELIKKWILIVVNASNRKEAKYAFKEEVNDYNKENIAAISNAALEFDLIDQAFKMKHKDISKFLYSGMGVDLQFHDSQIMSAILKQCINNDIVCYPIHDSLIIKEVDCNAAKKIMTECYCNYMKKTFNLTINPTINVDKK